VSPPETGTVIGVVYAFVAVSRTKTLSGLAPMYRNGCVGCRTAVFTWVPNTPMRTFAMFVFVCVLKTCRIGGEFPMLTT
jgi:hypothetical protein